MSEKICASCNVEMTRINTPVFGDKSICTKCTTAKLRKPKEKNNTIVDFKQMIGMSYQYTETLEDIADDLLALIKKCITVDFAKEGFICACWSAQISGKGLFFVVVTRERVLIKKINAIEQCYFRDVVSVERSYVQDTVLKSPGNSSDLFNLMNMPKTELLNLMFKKINDYWNEYKNSIQTATIAQNNSNDVLSSIEKLAELKVKGIITDEEFNSKKSELLAKL